KKFDGSGAFNHDLGPLSLDASGSALGLYDDGGNAEANFKLAAVAKLKQLADAGSINVGADGSIEIVDDNLSKANVNALLSVMAGKSVQLTAQGKISYDGKTAAADITQTFKGVWKGTQLDEKGDLHLAGGKLSGDVDAALKLLSGDAYVNVKAALDGN